MVRLSTRFMKRKSKKAGEDTQDEKKEFTKPTTQISFKEFSETDDIFLTNKQSENLELAINTGVHTWNIFNKSVGFMLLGCVFIFITSKFLFGEFKFASPIWVLITTFIMYLLVRSRYRAMKRITLTICIASYSPLLLLYGLYFVNGYAPNDKDTVARLFFILILAAVSYIIYGFLKLKKKAAPVGNKQLLILRVFGTDYNTAFLFREISRTWRFLGSFVTIADPSYIRYQYSLSSRENRRLFFNLFIFYFIFLGIVTYNIKDQLSVYFPSWLLLLWIKLPILQFMFIMGVLTMLAVLPVLLVSLTVITYRRFIPSLEALNKTIQKIISNKRSFSSTYKNFTLFCFDNVWKNAVKGSLPVSKAVLMDLRGFVPERRGCQYEIGLLINNYPVNKIVFLADEGSAVETIKEIVREEWNNMTANSPNHTIQDPELKIYYVREEDKKDINRIVALLTMGFEYSEVTAQATKSIAREIPAKERITKAAAFYSAGITTTEDGILIRKEKYFVKTKNKIGFFEKWDIRLARPSAAKIFIPILFILLMGGLIYQAIPFAKSFSKYKNPVRVLAMNGPKVLNIHSPLDSSVINFFATENEHPGENGSIGGQRYDSVLAWHMQITGGEPGNAYKYSIINIITKTSNNTELFTEQIENNISRYATSYHSKGGLINKQEGMIRIENKTYLFPNVHVIDSITGTIELSYIEPNQKYIVNRLDSLLSINGVLEIKIPDREPARKIWLEKSSADKEMFELLLPDYMEDYELHIFNARGEINYVPVMNNYNVWRFRNSELENAWMEIIPNSLFKTDSLSFRKMVDTRKWPFDKKE
jgi:hypothetical protein